MDSVYEVKTGTFQGPLELLLTLIEKRKLFINEISLAQVTDDYLAYTKGLGEFNVGRIANFIIIAATLILIKSRSLLPNIALTEEEAGDIANLEDRLNLYRIIRDASQKLKDVFMRPSIFERPFSRNKQTVFSPDQSFTVPNVHSAIQSVIERLPKKEILPKVTVKKVISLEEMIESISIRMQNEIKTSFSKLSGHTGKSVSREDKVNIIVGFLAMLELVKQGLIAVVQNEHFEDISIETGQPLVANN